MKLNFYVYLVLICSGLALFIACATEENYTPLVNPTLDELYNNAVVDAMVADSSEISNKLISVTQSNSFLSWKSIAGNDYVLVVTYTDQAWPYTQGDTVSLDEMETWVSMVPELKNRLQEDVLTNDSMKSLRASQLVGIPYLGTNSYFVEFWVKTDDLFRPTPDSEISDNTTGLYFPATATQEHIDWFNGTLIFAYFPDEGEPKYPFTRLGYTYDWGHPEQEFGVSEFVVRQGATVVVEKAYRLIDY